MIRRANSGLIVVTIVVVLIGAGSAWADLSDGLVAHWKLDGDANDSAGSNDGTLMGDPQWVTGKISGALEFDGAGDYVDCGNDGSLDITDEITISAWVKRPNFETYGVIAGKNNSATPFPDEGYGLFSYKEGFEFAFSSGTGGDFRRTTPRVSASANQWHHIVGTYDGNNAYLYIDGEHRASLGYVGTIVPAAGFPLYMSYWRPAMPHYFDGMIDDVRIYDRALSDSEVRQLYRGELLGFEITGPDTVAENFQAQYNAIAHYEIVDIDVTGLAEWSVEPNDNCGIAVGLLTTEPIDLPEDVTIYAEYTEDGNTVAAEKEVEIFAICPSGSALDFDGVDDYVEIADDDSLTPQSEITIAFWIYNRGGQSAGIFKYASCPGDPASPGESRAYYLDVYNDNQIQLRVFATAGLYDDLFGNTTNIPLNQWHHIAGTFNAGEAKVYLNGNLDNSKTMSVSSIMNDVNPLMIGACWAYCYGQPTLYPKLNGNIDEIAIYNRALSAEEIQGLMHTRPDYNEPNLVGYWDFDEGEEQIAADSSGNGNDGTLGSTGGVDDNDPNWVDSVPPVGICSLEGLVGRNISNVLDIKADILELLDIALGKEEALLDYMDDAFHNGEYDNLNKGDVVQAKQKLHSAIQQEEQAETTIGQSLEKLNDALDALGIDPTSWHQSEIEEEIIRADINADGVVDFRDFTILTEHWLESSGK